MKTVTPLQAGLLRRIAESEYSTVNGRVPETLAEVGQIWANTVIEDSQDKGTFTSLLHAGLADHYGHGEDSVLELTPAGFAAYKSL